MSLRHVRCTRSLCASLRSEKSRRRAETTNDIRGVANDDEAAYIIDDSGTLYTAKLASFEKPWTDPNNTKVENVTSAAPTGLSMIKGNLYAGSYPDWRLLGITPASGKRMFELDQRRGVGGPAVLVQRETCASRPAAGSSIRCRPARSALPERHCKRW